jgi:aspartyl-tRNA(Asn)/glutamyl-tRNA(Gln) amidotransferase subunit B
MHKNISNLFETLTQQSEAGPSAAAAVEAANLITGEIMRLMNNTNMLPEDLSIDAKKLSVLIGLVCSGKINRASYKETVEAVFKNNADPEKYIAEKGLMMVSDDKAVSEAVKAVIAENGDSVADYKAGKEKVFGFLMGQVMKKLGKGANPELAKKVLEEELK